MAQLNVKLGDDQIAALRAYAARRRTPVSWLVKDYIAYLLAGGQPVLPPEPDISSADLAAMVQAGGAFSWLAEEPELYSVDDGEAV